MLLDLHVHSNESDGSLPLAGVVDHAKQHGVDVIALCDHDTTKGARKIELLGDRAGVKAIGGVEISATWPSGNCHILGLGVRDDHEPLEKILAEIRYSRTGRNEQILAKLSELEMVISMEELGRIAGGDVIGRPHMARLMLEKGYVSSVKEAFDKYLAKGAPAYVDRYRLEPPGAVRLLKEAGATVILAHPTQLKTSMGELEMLIERVIGQGLDGIEVYTPYASDEEIVEYERLCARHGLLVTGGSDFHGESKPNHLMGYYRTDVPVPEDKVDLEVILNTLKGKPFGPKKLRVSSEEI